MVGPAKEQADSDDADRPGYDTQHAERAGLVGNQRMYALREGDVDGISGRVRLMMRHVEPPHAQREANRVEVLERLREVREVKDEKQERQDDGKRQGRALFAIDVVRP